MTEPVVRQEVRTAYDTVAESYADLLRDELAGSPWDLVMLGRFAELVGGSGPVGDLGCGPGRITTHLAALGLDAFGVDLSPGMIAQARRDHPVAELARVLAPGGWLLTAFQVGNERRHLSNAYGHDVDLSAYRMDPGVVGGLFADAGLVVEATLVRAPEPMQKSPQAHVLARKPA